MEIDINIIGDAELIDFFNELTSDNKIKVFRTAYRRAGKIILDEAKSILKGSKKSTYVNKEGFDKRLKGYKQRAPVMKSFAIVDLVDPRHTLIGVQVGNTSYVSRWLEKGTKDRVTKGRFKIGRKPVKRNTGKVEGIHFLEKATEAKGEEAMNSIMENVKYELEKMQKKYIRR